MERPENRVRLARRCWIREVEADDLDARCAAALATSSPDSVLVGPTAARLHGLWLPDLDDVIGIATASPGRPGRDMTRSRRPEFRAHRLQIPEEDTMVLRGLPVTTPARTWRDLAPVLGLPALVAAGDSVLRTGTPQADIADVVRRAVGARHVRRLRAALGMLDGRSRSRPESHLRVAVSGDGMPRFAVNEPIHRAVGGWLAEPDLSLADARLALEYQGSDHADPRRMRRDLTRSMDLRSEGWLVLAYGPAEVFGRPWEIRAEVRAAIAHRAPTLLRRR